MFLPETLYQEGLSQKDFSQWPFNFHTEKINSTSATATMFLTSAPVRPDKALAVQTLRAKAIGGGGQLVTEMTFFFSDGVAYFYFQGKFENPAISDDVLNFAEELIIPPNWRVGAVITFSAGAVANTGSLDITGWQIPAGALR